jgi:formylglycine-generating enzyme required for sulfatase activity
VLGLVARPFLFPSPPPKPEPDPEPPVVVPKPPIPTPKPTVVVLPYPREVPPPPKPTLPPGYTAAEDAELHGEPEGPLYASRIFRRVGEERVVMRLIPGPAPFYVMENKVWNGLFERFAQENPGLVGETWRLGGKADGDDVGVANRRHPALRMNRTDAIACAAWLGGRLPRAAQLDRAAQVKDRPANPDLAVGRRRDGPRPVGTSAGDRSSFGVYDLAGNGWEWTRDPAEGGELAVLRGRSYAASGPASDVPLAQYPGVGSPYTGFRVVIELSAP